MSYKEGLLAPRPTPKLEDHPLSAVHDCLFNLFAATLYIGGHSSIRNLTTRHAVVTGTHYMDNSFTCTLLYVRHLPSPVCRRCPIACLRNFFYCVSPQLHLLSQNWLFCSRDSSKHMSHSDIATVALWYL